MRAFLALSCACLVLGCAQTGKEAGEPFTTWADLRYGNVVMQEYDFSCGFGSLATLMTFHFGDEVGELDLLRPFYEGLDDEARAVVVREGVSVKDLRDLALERGYEAYGAWIEPAHLFELDRPVIVHIRLPDTEHFAVLRGIRDGMVFLADPSRGNLRLSLPEFLDEWGEPLILALHKPGAEPVAELAVGETETAHPGVEALASGLRRRPRLP